MILFYPIVLDAHFQFSQLDFSPILPSKYLLVLKKSWRRPQDLSWERLQHVFSITILRLPRTLQDVLKTFSRPLARCLQDVLEDEKLLRWRRLQDVLKTYLEDVFKTSRRQTKFLLVISVSNKSKCVSNKCLFHKLCLRNLRRIQNASLRTQ